MRETTQEDRPARLRLMGPVRLTAAGGNVVDIPSRRARAVLAYLALSPERSATRERLCGLLWSDRGEPQARASLRQCLLELRGAFTRAGVDLLAVDREAFRLKERLATDIGDVEDALENQSSDLASLVSGFGDGRLLEDLDIGGLFDDWRRAAAERIDRLIASGVEARLRTLEDASNWTAALALAESYLRRDPLDERVAASAIRANIALGAAGAAQRLYQSLQTALSNELGVSPGAAAREALTFEAPPAAEPRVSSVPGKPTPASHMAGHRRLLPLPDKPSIAVLPFKNLSGDPDQEYFTDAITEDIVAALSRWRWFFVIAHNSSFTYKNSDVSLDRFGSELGVRYVLTGSVRRSGNRVRVTTQLVDTGDNTQFWAEKFDRDLTDIFDLQDEITETVVAAIEPAMLNIEGARLATKVLHDYSALDCYYRGMWHLNRVSKAGYEESVAHFREAIARDPALPLGYIGLSRILWGGAVFGWTDDPIRDLGAAQTAAGQAIALSPNDAMAFFASAGAALYLGDHAGALNASSRSIAINQNFALASVRLGHVMVFAGKPREAIEPIKRGLRLSPSDPQLAINLNLMSVAHYQAGDYEEAVRHALTAIDHGPEKRSFVLAASLARLGRFEEAARYLPRTDARSNSVQRPLAARYANAADWEHWREGVRMAGALVR